MPVRLATIMLRVALEDILTILRADSTWTVLALQVLLSSVDVLLAHETLRLLTLRWRVGAARS